MRLGERDRPARLKGHDVHVHVVREIVRVDEPGRRPRVAGVGHRSRCDLLIAGHERRRDIDPLGLLIRLAHPLESDRLRAVIAQRPLLPGGEERVAPGREDVPRPRQGQRELASGDEDHSLDTRFRLRMRRPAARRDLDDQLRERRRETGDRARDDPRAGAGEAGQVAGDDVAQHALRDHRVRLFDDGAVGQQLALAGQATGRCVVGHRFSNE